MSEIIISLLLIFLGAERLWPNNSVITLVLVGWLPLIIGILGLLLMALHHYVIKKKRS